MPGRKAFLRRRHVAAAATRRAVIDVIEARRAASGGAPPKAERMGSWTAERFRPQAGDPRRGRYRAAGRALQWLRGAGGPARAAPGPAAPNADVSRPARSRRSERTSPSEPEWTRNDTCGRYSSYSEGTTADNVSSPGPRTRRGYSEDSRNGA